jgi:acid stress-induced BolA-like protein IbaG/YrbA|uniref:Stress-induced morphogen family protein n=3 Tax=environmental samples TaxID=68359 RepID=A0A075G1X0_9EURY|nr:Stress-induced morphogen family protein [uncultured marine group II/III euryarchaeote AD1000_69_E07]AIE97012.1 Stress-induced morphogen family protein [uncultured marine group II/III euryarchaeote AD1000_89_E12]AIF15111.1 Stress-induced morphogen family protein [uncultured marine group II/III euryarchaeote KM3_69_G09]|tara:strand:- start:488 stop:811 length:324 start_codon:yes stop_codon:yes gene_type:complete
MVTEQWMIEEVLKVVPDARVEASDLHGSGDHFHVRVISESYEGVRPLQRQRPILNHFKPFIAQNTVHALDLKCMTPAQSAESGDTAFDPHGEEVEFFGVHIRRPDKE